MQDPEGAGKQGEFGVNHRGKFGTCTIISAALLFSPKTSTAQSAAAASASQAPAAQQTAPESSAPFRAFSRLVVVDAVVTNHAGEPVHGLKREDFHISEDGVEQPITAFEELVSNTQPAPSPALKLPPNTYTNYEEKPATTAVNLLLLDALNTPMKDQAYVREQMIKYLKDIP
jgi:hypothetical protein